MPAATRSLTGALWLQQLQASPFPLQDPASILCAWPAAFLYQPRLSLCWSLQCKLDALPVRSGGALKLAGIVSTPNLCVLRTFHHSPGSQATADGNADCNFGIVAESFAVHGRLHQPVAGGFNTHFRARCYTAEAKFLAQVVRSNGEVVTQVSLISAKILTFRNYLITIQLQASEPGEKYRHRVDFADELGSHTPMWWDIHKSDVRVNRRSQLREC